jgi:pimeloyl-ACP methyl ester carboxylesterase
MQTTRSADGTTIAFTRSGAGPGLVLVSGGLSDHRAAAPLLPFLEPHFTVYAFDRRGRGASGPAGPYEVDREVEDVAVLLDQAGEPVHLFGHSSGAVLALEAALRGLPLTTLALSEPPFVVNDDRPRPPADLADRLEALLAAGDREAALAAFLREGMGLSEEAVDQIKASPQWAPWLALVHTIPFDLRIVGQGYVPFDRVAALRTPTLVLQGGASPAWMRAGTAALARALPNGRLAVLEGQGHAAAQDAPQLLAAELVRFASSSLGGRPMPAG